MVPTQSSPKPGIAMPRRGEGPNQIDIHVGSRLRLRRTLLGYSQERLGQAVGITFQQLQKYERGINRISASRLYQLSRVLGVGVGYFFENLAEDGSEEIDADSVTETAATRDTLELIRAYSRVANSDVRRRMVDLFRALAEPDLTSEGE